VWCHKCMNFARTTTEMGDNSDPEEGIRQVVRDLKYRDVSDEEKWEAIVNTVENSDAKTSMGDLILKLDQTYRVIQNVNKNRGQREIMERDYDSDVGCTDREY
jgi:hypothetical protein